MVWYRPIMQRWKLWGTCDRLDIETPGDAYANDDVSRAQYWKRRCFSEPPGQTCPRPRSNGKCTEDWFNPNTHTVIMARKQLNNIANVWKGRYHSGYPVYFSDLYNGILGVPSVSGMPCLTNRNVALQQNWHRSYGIIMLPFSKLFESYACKFL